MNNQITNISPINVVGYTAVDNVPNIYDTLKKKVQEAYLGLLPEETMKEMIDNEIKSFFELQDRVYTELPVINMTRKEAISKGYDFTSVSTWDTSPNSKVTVKQIGMVTPMSPFRHLVWHELGTILQVKIKEAVSETGSEFKKKLDIWFQEECVDEIKQVTTLNFNSLAMLMAKQNQYETMVRSVKVACSIVDSVHGMKLDSNQQATYTSTTNVMESMLANIRNRDLFGS